MSKKKKDDKSPEKAENSSWDAVRNTATRTELQTVPDADIRELLLKAGMQEAALIVVQGESMGKVFRLKPGRNVIGRHVDSTIQINQRAVSSFHTDIRVGTDQSAILEDLKSLNGTYVNSNKVETPVLLKQNDLVKVGSYVFKYVDNHLDASFSETLHEAGTIDTLTGAYNKGHLLKLINSSIDIAKGGFLLSLIIFDLDHFKKVNDTYGHIAGDYVLKESVKIIRDQVIRADDKLGRFGGEEFVVLMHDTPLQVAKEVAERVRATLAAHAFEFEGQRIPVTASLGVALWNPSFKSAADFLNFVDQLLYKSKQNGRNRVSFEQ
ncbi:MAG TPA: GGDEF domain-containing protein [Bdellovibrionota bacterium]|nr:GGDEF domain-containing protein [Bdellovibrionota bacterium]